ncbi:MAG: tetratricopeptide repeat protein, partial [Chthoniobacterales bacterium]
FEEFVRDRPNHPAVVTAMFWIGKAKAHEGKTDEAKQVLVTELQKNINDPKRDTVETLLDQLAQLCSKPPRPLPGKEPAAAPGATPVPYDAAAELDLRLAALASGANQTGHARLLYARAQLAKLQRRAADYDKLNLQIATQFLPEELSPLLLANAGDALLAQGNAEKAAKFYNELKEFYPNSTYRDSAEVGLAEIAFRKKDYAGALEIFTAAADLAGAKVKEATVGEARSLVELGRYDEARKLFEQIAAMREWRGETTAEAVYALGDIQARQQKWAEAVAYYQRVFVLYQRFLPWVAKSYIGAAESFDRMGKRPEAVGHLREMLRNEKLRDFPETEHAREMLQGWGESA